MIYKKAVATLLLGITFFVSAQDNWIKIAETEGAIFEAKRGTLELLKTNSQDYIRVVVGRISEKVFNQVGVYNWYVTIKDCQREIGKVVFLNLE